MNDLLRVRVAQSVGAQLPIHPPPLASQTESLAISMKSPYERNLGQLRHMAERWDQVGRSHAFDAADAASLRRWRRRLLSRLKTITGFNTMTACDFRPVTTEVVDCGDYLRERVEIHTEPHVVMPIYVLIPKSGTPPYPVMLAPHGHCGGGKAATAGCREGEVVAKAITELHYDYGVQFVRAGFITFCPDARGFGERQEPGMKDDIIAHSCQWINNMAYPLGQTMTGMLAWDMHRLVSYVQTRDDCDGKRIGSAGLSGGGHQTLWASIFDQRIKCAVVSGYLYGYKESLLEMHQNCSCNFVPHLYETADMGDIAALIAPRPLLVETGDSDPLNGASGVRNVTSQLRTTRRAYRIFGAEKQLKHDVFEGGHRWHGVKAIPFMQKHLHA